MPNCLHHVQWVRKIPGGMHQCIQCFQVVTKKDVYPKFEDLGDEYRRRWEAHEAAGLPPDPASGAEPPRG